jgi:hypothetical protein
VRELDYSAPSLFSAFSVLELLASVFRPQNLNTKDAEKSANAEKEAAVPVDTSPSEPYDFE